MNPHATFNYCVSPECVVTRGLIATRGGNHTAVTVAGTSTEYVPQEKDHFSSLVTMLKIVILFYTLGQEPNVWWPPVVYG